MPYKAYLSTDIIIYSNRSAQQLLDNTIQNKRENYKKRNKNEENNKIGWILNLVMKKRKTGGFSRFTNIWLFLARNRLRRALCQLLYMVIFVDKYAL